MNKSLNIIMIILLSFIAVGLSLFLYVLLKDETLFEKFSFSFFMSGKSTTLVESKEFDSYKDINIKSNVADVTIEYSEDDKVKVELYSDNLKKHSIDLVDETIVIEHEDKKTSLFKKFPRIVVYVPRSFEGAFDITNQTGDIEVLSFDKATFKVETTTGDVKIDSADVVDVSLSTGDIDINEVNTVKVTCSTGDIDLGTINDSLDLRTTTGDITINEANLKTNSNIKTTTGDVRINKITNTYVETESKTGDTKIANNDRFAEVLLHIKVTTGDITVK